MVAPATHAPMAVDLNATHAVGGSSTGGQRKHARKITVDMLPDARNQFDTKHTTSATTDDDTTNCFSMENIIFERGAPLNCSCPPGLLLTPRSSSDRRRAMRSAASSSSLGAQEPSESVAAF